VIEGAGLSAKLQNATPGGLVIVVGVILIAISLRSSVKRTQRTPGIVPTEILDDWLLNSFRVTDETRYDDLHRIVIGGDATTRIKSKFITPSNDMTLRVIAKREYGDEKYWRLVAAINQGRPNIKLAEVSPDTTIRAGSAVEIWYLSIYHGKDTLTVTEVAKSALEAGYDHLLSLAQSGKPYDFDELHDWYRDREISVMHSSILFNDKLGDDVRTLREVSLKFYGTSKYWPIIVWANKAVFSMPVTEDTITPRLRLTIPMLFNPSNIPRR